MTLRDALEQAYRDHDPPPYADSVAIVAHERGRCQHPCFDAILSDPAFRAALTEAVGEALAFTGHVGDAHRLTLGIDPAEHTHTECLFAEPVAKDAAAIVARMLP